MDLRIRVLGLIFGYLFITPVSIWFKGPYVNWLLVLGATGACAVVGLCIGVVLTKMRALSKRMMISSATDFAALSATFGVVA
jgi:hypothetical protein